MSKVVITVDTQAGTLDVVADGEKLENVSSVSAYCYEDYGNDEDRVSINISMMERPENKGDLAKFVSLVARVKEDLHEEKKTMSELIGSLLKHYGKR